MTLYEFKMLNEEDQLKTVWSLPDTDQFIYK